LDVEIGEGETPASRAAKKARMDKAPTIDEEGYSGYGGKKPRRVKRDSRGL
jgi:hypothetical protein